MSISAQSYLGAEGAEQLITLLTGDRPDGRIVLTGERDVVVRRPSAVEAPSAPFLLDRHVLRLAPAPRPPIDVPIAAFPPGALIVTNSAEPLATDAATIRVTAGAATLHVGGRSTTLDSGVDLPALLGAVPRHVRVLADCRDQRLHQAGWSDAARELLQLHEWTFLAAKATSGALGEDASFLVTVLDGATTAAVPRPFTGLFTGLVKSLALEYPATPVIAVVHDGGCDVRTAVERAATELGARQFFPVVYLCGGRRLIPVATEQPAVPVEGASGLTRDSLVVAAGGARGIGAPILTALAQSVGPRIVVIGSSAPPDPDGLAAGAGVTRSEFIAAQVRGPDKVTVGEASRRFDAMEQARAVQDTFAELERHCGAGRVEYVRCDLRDTDAVREVVGALLQRHGDVDLLINIAGTNRASDVATKSVEDFRVVRDLKVRTYLNLKDAFGPRLPARWCNFGSFVGFTGQRGETDYGAANDFLNTAAAASSRPGEFTIGWTLWRDVGLGSSPVMASFLEKSDQFTGTPPAEGVAHFLAELAGPGTDPTTVMYGAKERAAIDVAVPGYRAFCAQAAQTAAPAAPQRVLPFIDEVRSDGPGELTALRSFDLHRDGYLELHQVDGHATLPGTFVPELAAEAAVALVPGRMPVVFEDLRLESFLRVYRPDRPERKRIQARLVASDDVESVVDVRVLGELVAPNGVVLAADRLHFSVRVRLRDQPVASPHWEHWDDQDTGRMADPYHVAGSGVLLRDVFESTTATRVHPLGRRGRFSLDPDGIRRWFPDLIVPSVSLDGLVRVAVLECRLGRFIPVAIPRSIRRIDLYGTHTDLSLAESKEQIELYVTPIDLDLEDPEPDNRALAVRPNGDVLLQVKDIVGRIVGFVDEETGLFVERERFDREHGLLQ